MLRLRFLLCALCLLGLQPAALAATPAAPSPQQSAVRRVGPWLLLDTANFTVCTTRHQDPVELANRCETLRAELFNKLTGRPAESTWSPRCYVVCHPTEASYLRDVGAGAGATRASSDVTRIAGQITARRIDLRGDRPDPLREGLPHELTHVVIADAFRSKLCPLWADEGLAVLADIADKRAAFRQELTQGMEREELFPLAQLLRFEDYPAPESRALFFGQSVSLVEFLMSRKDPETFFAFVRKSEEVGYDAALEQTYGIADLRALERLWKAHLSRD